MRKKTILRIGFPAMALCALGAWANAAAASGTLEASAFPAWACLRPENLTPGSPGIDIACAKNEYESFQVAVLAKGAMIKEVRGELTPLRNEAGQQIPSERTVLYREAYVPVRQTAPRAAEAPGLVPDPLVPVQDPYTGKPVRPARWNGQEVEGARFGGMPFELWPGHAEAFWMDVFVPRDTAPGLYTGVFRVLAEGVGPVELPVRLTVWNFTLPDGPTHENHFGGFERIAPYWHVQTDSDAFAAIEDRFIAMLAEHRINPSIPARLRPKPGEDGSVAFDADLDRRFSEFVARYHVTNVEIPRAPFADILGADRARALNFYRSWYAYVESKGWAERAYLYLLDEPNDAEAYERVRQLGALVREAQPAIRRLVVEQPYAQDPAWGALDEAIDIWCPLFGFIHEPSVRRVRSQGASVWSYTALVQTAPPYHPEYEAVKNDLPPFWQIGFPLSSYRIAPWINRRYGITGLLYWSTVYWGSPDRNPWLEPGFRIRWNGDGALFYPGIDTGIDGPIASLRLKNLRDGMEDYEYFALLEKAGGAAVVDEAVKTAVPAWGAWNQEGGALEALREKLAEEIVKRGS